MKTFFSNIQEAVRIAPLWVIVLTIYSALTSSIVFSDAARAQLIFDNWQPSFVNIGDVILLAGIVFSWIILRLSIDRGILIFLGYLFFAIVVSQVLSPIEFSFASLTDATIDYLRFALVFALAAALTKRYGAQITSIYALIPFALLSSAALWVYYTSVDSINRLSAPALTIGSFAQICALAIIVTAENKYWLLLALGAYMLRLTGSPLPTFALLIAVAIWLASSRPLPGRLRVLVAIAAVLGLMVWVIQGLNDGGLERAYNGVLEFVAANPRVQTLDTRTQIWSFAWQFLGSGVMGPTGIGFNQSPYYLSRTAIDVVGTTETINARHFHSLIFEWVIGFGVLCIPLFIMLLRRIWQTWRGGAFLAMMILMFFLSVQSVDFSFFRPKEIVVWSLMLGIAEGQWRAHEAAKKAAAEADDLPVPVLAPRARRVPELATVAAARTTLD